VWLRILVAIPIGLAVGSFMTVVVDRVPNEESVIQPRSRCPKCHEPIRPSDNVPVLSWIRLRGRCRSCGEPISKVYPIVELTTAAVITGAVVRYEDLRIGLVVAALLALMPALAVIDIRHRIIPNRIVYPALIAFPIALAVIRLAGADVNLVGAAIGLVSYGGGLFLIAVISRGMGMGDVKLAALIGLVLGSLGVRYVGVAAGSAILLGGVGAIVALASGRGRKSAIPFGPYLAAGAVVAGLWGQPIAMRYLHTLG
jgi:leader peptidase (prepilin peptidase)/N-methyltransferase